MREIENGQNKWRKKVDAYIGKEEIFTKSSLIKN